MHAGAPHVESVVGIQLAHKWNSTLLERARQLQALVRRRLHGLWAGCSAFGKRPPTRAPAVNPTAAPESAPPRVGQVQSVYTSLFVQRPRPTMPPNAPTATPPTRAPVSQCVGRILRCASSANACIGRTGLASKVGATPRMRGGNLCAEIGPVRSDVTSNSQLTVRACTVSSRLAKSRPSRRLTDRA